MATSDSLLWAQLKGGNKAALEKIYNAEVEYLFNYCKRITNNDDVIEDAIQELFIELWERRSGLGMTDSIRPYLLTSIRRKVIYLLKQKGKISLDGEDSFAFKSDHAVESEIIEREQKSEHTVLLHHAMQNLSNRQREAIYHKFFNGFSYDEICELMNINYQSARNLISSGLRRIKADIGNQLFFWFLLSTIYYLFT